MIITAIEKDKSKYRVYIDDHYAFSLYPKELEKHSIIINHPIDAQTVRAITERTKKRGMIYAYHLLAKKNYTRYELYQRLIKTGVLITDAEHILDQLTQKGFIDDLSYVNRYYENNHLQKSYKQMVYVLKAKGIDQEVISEGMPMDESDDYEAAKRITEKRLKGKRQLTYEEKRKLYHYLANKGFSNRTIRSILGELDTQEVE